jgi:hypothetical protein
MYVAIFHHHLHKVFISHNRFDVQERVPPMISFYIKVGSLHIKWCHRSFYSLILSQHFASSTVVITIWFVHTSSLWVECWLMCFITFVRRFDTCFDYGILSLVGLEKDLRRMWPIEGRCCLLLLAICSHLWFVQGSVFAQSYRFIFHNEFMRLVNVRYITFPFNFSCSRDLMNKTIKESR